MEVDIVVAGIALVTVTLGFTLLYVQRVNRSKKIDSMNLEAEVHHQASYGMARHLKYIQLQNEMFGKAENDNHISPEQPRAKHDADTTRGDSTNVGMTADIVDFRSPRNVSSNNHQTSDLEPEDRVLDSAVERLFSEGADARKLSQALGVSRSEAEIIAHIGPKHRNLG